jgi:hypothetical protein
MMMMMMMMMMRLRRVSVGKDRCRYDANTMRSLDPAGPNEPPDNHHQTIRTSPITHP